MGLQRRIRDFLSTRNVSEDTKKSYYVAINHFVRWMKVNGFYNAGTACRLYRIDLEREGCLSASTIKFYASMAKSYSRWLSETKVSEGYEIPDRTKLGIGMPKPPEKILPSDLQFICSHLARRGPEGLRSRAILVLAVTCCLTPEEICDLSASDLLVTDEGAWLTVRRDDNAHQIPIPGCAAQAILDYLAVRIAPSNDLPLFVRRNAGATVPMTPKLVGKAVSESLDVLRIDVEEALPGDSQLTVITHMSRLKPEGRRELATYASCLYFADVRL